MDFICSDKPAAIIGFTYGFLDSICSDKDCLKTPLSSVVVAGINGLVYGFGASLVSAIVLPTPAKPLLPAILILAMFKKHHNSMPWIFDEIKKGAKGGISDLQNNGSQKLTDVTNEVKETTVDLFNSAKKKMD